MITFNQQQKLTNNNNDSSSSAAQVGMFFSIIFFLFNVVLNYLCFMKNATITYKWFGGPFIMLSFTIYIKMEK
jgi:hypothetical protein